MIIGFDINTFLRDYLESCSNEQLKDLHKQNPNTTTFFNSAKEFCECLNDECVNTEEFWYFVVD